MVLVVRVCSVLCVERLPLSSSLVPTLKATGTMGYAGEQGSSGHPCSRVSAFPCTAVFAPAHPPACRLPARVAWLC